MVPFLFTAREHHSVRDAEQYAAVHAMHIATRRLLGARFEVHDDPAPLVARVDANSWIVDCGCGAGNATDPEWGVAYCFGCGAVHRHIAFPASPDLIEAILVARPEVGRRGWTPGQSVEDLVAEARSVGAAIPAVIEAHLEAVAEAEVTAEVPR